MENKKKWSFDVNELKKIVKGISLDKWLLMGAAGLVLIFCSDSCQGGDVGNDDGTLKEEQASYSGLAKTSNDASISYGGYGTEDYISYLENKLENILMSVEGAGNVQVMITLKNSATKEVLMEEPYTESNMTESDGDGGSRDSKEKVQGYTVIYEENGDGTSIPFIVSEKSPDIEGVAVVAEGGDSAVVKEKITGIIKALFDIEINKIAVGKMK